MTTRRMTTKPTTAQIDQKIFTEVPFGLWVSV
jgi:hypothetical protein